MDIKTLLELCEASIGYIEGPNNNTSFGKWFGLTDTQISQVFPNLTRFMPDLSNSTLVNRNLDFINFA